MIEQKLDYGLEVSSLIETVFGGNPIWLVYHNTNAFHLRILSMLIKIAGVSTM
jgi:hypothetical protein